MATVSLIGDSLRYWFLFSVTIRLLISLTTTPNSRASLLLVTRGEQLWPTSLRTSEVLSLSFRMEFPPIPAFVYKKSSLKFSMVASNYLLKRLKSAKTDKLFLLDCWLWGCSFFLFRISFLTLANLLVSSSVFPKIYKLKRNIEYFLFYFTNLMTISIPLEVVDVLWAGLDHLNFLIYIFLFLINVRIIFHYSLILQSFATKGKRYRFEFFKLVFIELVFVNAFLVLMTYIWYTNLSYLIIIY